MYTKWMPLLLYLLCSSALYAEQRFVQMGDRVPDFEAETLDGRVFAYDDEIDGPVLINFWATWCHHCVIEMDDLAALSKETEFAGKIQIITVNVGETAEAVATSAQEIELPGIGLLDPDMELAELFGVEAVPTSLFINAEHVVVARRSGRLDIEALRGLARESMAVDSAVDMRIVVENVRRHLAEDGEQVSDVVLSEQIGSLRVGDSEQARRIVLKLQSTPMGLLIEARIASEAVSLYDLAYSDWLYKTMLSDSAERGVSHWVIDEHSNQLVLMASWPYVDKSSLREGSVCAAMLDQMRAFEGLYALIELGVESGCAADEEVYDEHPEPYDNGI